MASLTITSIYLVKLCEVRNMSFEEVKEIFKKLTEKRKKIETILIEINKTFSKDLI